MVELVSGGYVRKIWKAEFGMVPTRSDIVNAQVDLKTRVAPYYSDRKRRELGLRDVLWRRDFVDEWAGSYLYTLRRRWEENGCESAKITEERRRAR